jgi:hypothetical protein
MWWDTGARIGLFAVLAVSLLGGAGVAGADQPAWADDLFGEMEEAADEYNDHAAADERGVVERWLLRGARVDVLVRGEGDATAAYSFRIDDRYRVTDLRRGTHDDPTLRVKTSRAVVRRVTAADDTGEAIRRAVERGDIRLVRVLEPVPGWEVGVGAVGAAVGVGGVGLVVLAATKFGADGLLSAAGRTVQRTLGVLGRLVRLLWAVLEKVLSVLTLLDYFGWLDPVRDAVAALGERIRRLVGWTDAAPSTAENDQ